jgi:hypothetical protein
MSVAVNGLAEADLSAIEADHQKFTVYDRNGVGAESRSQPLGSVPLPS